MKLSPFVLEWIRRAEQDYKMGLYALKHASLSEQACFHAEQLAEKYLKSFLMVREVKFPKTHHLLTLVRLCSEQEASFDELKESTLFLDQLYLESRYPSELHAFTPQESKKAFQLAKRIRKFVLDRLK